MGCEKMNTVSLLIILMFLGTAVLIDVVSHRIPNSLVVILLLLGLLSRVIESGFLGFISSAAGFFVGGLLLLPFYAIGSMGAGDVKLMGAMGALLGPIQVFQAVFATLVFGGALGLLVVVCSRQSKLFFARYGSMAKTLICTGQFVYQARTADDPASQRFAYAAAIALGTVFVLYQNNSLDALVQL